MYLNERAWTIKQNNIFKINNAIKDFLQVYKKIMHTTQVYVPDNISSISELSLFSHEYPLQKWLSEADFDLRMLFKTFWTKRITYKPSDDYEIKYGEKVLQGGLEAYSSNSFMISICFDDTWQKEFVNCQLISVYDEPEQSVRIHNLYKDSQIDIEPFHQILYSYQYPFISDFDELWKKTNILFSYLHFCPSVEKNFSKLDNSCLHAVYNRLIELNEYCRHSNGSPFNPKALSLTTRESNTTLQMYCQEHTFIDKEGNEHIASWHCRFTGIAGRIFFDPDENSQYILICYVGDKLPNASNST